MSGKKAKRLSTNQSLGIWKRTLGLSLLLPLTIMQLTLLTMAGLLLLPVALFLRVYRRHLARQLERELKNVEAVVEEAGDQIGNHTEVDRVVLKARMTILKLKGKDKPGRD